MLKKIRIRTSSLILCSLGLISALSHFSSVASAQSSTPPNILFILTDDQGWSQMSGLMDPEVPEAASAYLKTPNMDRIGAKGMRFTSGYSPAPLCTPTRRSVLCGTSAVRSGTEFVSTWVPADHMTIAKALKQANPNYRSAHFGKWGDDMISSPEECGYDVSDGNTNNDTGGMKGRGQAFNLIEDPKRTDSVTQRTREFMREQVEAGKPFYAQVSYYAVHLSVEVREATLRKYEAKGEPDRGYTPGWAGMLEELDKGIGGLLDELEALGIAENTYVFFMSDNGGRGGIPTGNKSSLSTNYPLSGAKHSLNEGGVRVPFMVYGPGIEAGSICRTPVIGYDLLPTFYDLAGGEQTLPTEVDGGSLTPLFADSENGEVIRSFDGLTFHRPKKGYSALREGDYKLLLRSKKGKLKSKNLYNVAKDPYEKENLAGSSPEKVKALHKKLNQYIKETETN